MAVLKEDKTGIIDSFYDEDSGKIKETGSNALRDFVHPGANVDFRQGDAVNYVMITLPTGNVIINDIKKPM